MNSTGGLVLPTSPVTAVGPVLAIAPAAVNNAKLDVERKFGVCAKFIFEKSNRVALVTKNSSLFFIQNEFRREIIFTIQS